MMQSSNSLVTKFARNLFKYCHQQQGPVSNLLLYQKSFPTGQPQWMQINYIHYAAMGCVYQQFFMQRQQQIQNQQLQAFQTLSHKTNFLNIIKNSTPAINNRYSQSSAQLLRSYSKFTTRPTDPPHVLNISHQPLTAERATELIASLKDAEREHIKEALEKYEAIKMKEHFVGTLAATQWRTRFGRPTKLRALGDVDPTGTFCAFPDDWLKQKAVQNAKQPTKAELWKLFLVNAVPFIGFGFLDNFTMIIAGDYIETTLGYFMTLSTMAAAGLGNTISDVLGIGSAFYVERVCELMGLRPPELTAVQMELKSSRRAANYGRIIGIVVGCLVGMFPLLFMDKRPTEKVHPVSS